jgi:Ca-activated chloride channel family protein
MTRPSLALVVVVVAAAAALPAAQPQFRASIEAVRLDVSVTRGGLPVGGLRADDFLVTDNGAPQRVESVSLESVPLSVMLVLDTSGSVAGERLSQLADAGRTLVGALHAGDRASLLTFSRDIVVRVPMTPDREAIVGALGTLKGYGATAFRNAVFSALQLAPQDETRPLILVFTDGRDNISWLTQDDLLNAVRQAGVVVHAVELLDPARVTPASRAAADMLATYGLKGASPLTLAQAAGGMPEGSPFLASAVAAAGGRRWPAASGKELKPLFAQALDEMRARYLLTFYPQGERRAGWHALKVSLTRGRADITARPGYVVPSAR